MHAFKFIASRDVASFMSGTVRVGTARGYGIKDQNVNGRGDPTEAVASYPAPATPVLASQLPEPWKRLFKSDDASSLENLTIYLRPEARLDRQHNFFVFCASMSISKAMIYQISVMFGADRCVRISDFQRFARLVCDADERLWKSVVPNMADYEIICGPVSYAHKSYTKVFGFVNPLSKPFAFQWQREVRAVFPGYPKEPVFVDIPDVVPLLREVDLVAFGSLSRSARDKFLLTGD